MTFTEIVNKDLFTVSNDYYLVQCISADFGMGAGIAAQFNKHFDMKNKLTKRYKNLPLLLWDEGHCGQCILEDGVFNLITKRNYWQKPTYQSLNTALIKMKGIMEKKEIKKIAMPMIGCGLDQLEWQSVSLLIRTVFADSDTDIIICRR